jgi:hypothetical protein
MKSALIVAILAIAGLALVPAAASADANGNHAVYAWIVGAVPAGSSDTAVAPDGTTVTLKGSGTFTAGPGNTASGGGTYSFSSGGSGHWTVTGVQGFVSYGSGAAQGLPKNLTGGEVKLNITLDNGSTGVLTIYCLLGSPPAGKEEGITLILGSGGQFTKQDGGNTVFILS